MDQSFPLIDRCLAISGFYEGGEERPRFDLLTGNFDGAGISVGCLQWNPGTGSLMELLPKIFEKLTNVDEDIVEQIQPIVDMDAPTATDYCIKIFLTPAGKFTPAGREIWGRFLNLPESKAAQEELAQSHFLDKAIALAAEYLPWAPDHERAIAFFFDVVVQSGSMGNKRGKVSPIALPDQATSAQAAINYATNQGKAQTAAAWKAAWLSEPDLVGPLLHYGFLRSALSRPEYQWDACSRRCCIAARQGQVHGRWCDFTEELP